MPRLFVVSGPGGAGKNTIVDRLLADDPTLWESRSWTTRARRPNEPEGAYTFVDRPTFERRIAEGGFLEWAEYVGNLYGTPLPEPPPGCDVILVIEVQGARQVLERVPDAVMILVVPPSRAVQEERLRARGDTDEHVAKRLAVAAEEERVGRELAHHLVVNDDLAGAVREVAGILARYRTNPPSEGTA
ncbi:MAG: guanylate kinase [Actinomycetota bacterium]|nr:guanylate kinase [Actinomycetota bacterium]